ncbi:MAG: disulfide bond formation protein DsbA [Candidatus Magasanikbacteria bacterium CG11_big_fil_rev_8_21_14_0_20_39_34]|uniref:Disulfide bond formation protein DsbA n=1 Tax=Candidatus Magasanikbacteria bacterium CG11_big_fil_rev_8_21_14_0_20_39_34 TaxID=1974653 RepID=A0A2H0N6G4_9BACT|nr:MAG: disulfide bond formation protein DsbA [Candidatus Magasanikbacteria bacterium CG11_big_fil_rev_8_21_14_0_20_39_34]
MKHSNRKSLYIWGGFILGVLLLIWGLSKLTGLSGSTLTTSIDAKDHVSGNPNAPLTLVEYSDFQCPACKHYYPLVKQLVKSHENDLQVVYRHFPLESIHEHALLAAQAAEAASLQGRFWDMHDILFNTQDIWVNDENPKERIIQYAESLRLDIDQFRNDMDSKEVTERVNRDINSGHKANISGTPTFFLNGVQIQAPPQYDEFEKIISQALK